MLRLQCGRLVPNMENDIKLNPHELQIQGVLDQYLASRNEQTGTDHIEEDSLAAFVEGSFSERESGSIVSHLVGCGFCRNATAELVRLDMAFAEQEIPAAAPSSEPAKISEVLSGIFAKIFGSTESTVFAHEESKDEKRSDENTDEPK